MPSTSTDPLPATTAVSGTRPTRIAVERAGDRARFSVLDQGLYLAPRPVAGTAGPLHLRVALIGIHMMLLGGDDVRIELHVGSGVTLEVIEPAGMVAYDADGCASRWSLDAVLAEGSALIWDGAPFVVAGGANVQRETRVRFAERSRVLLRETLVLGRSGEPGGALRSVTRLTGPSGDSLYEDLDLTGIRHRSVGVLGESKVLTSATAAGWRPAAGPPAPVESPERRRQDQAVSAHRFELAAEGSVLRALAASAHEADREVAPQYAQWSQELLR